MFRKGGLNWPGHVRKSENCVLKASLADLSPLYFCFNPQSPKKRRYFPLESYLSHKGPKKECWLFNGSFVLYFYCLMEIPKFNISVHCPTSQETKMNNIVWLLFILDLYFFWYLTKRDFRGRRSAQNYWLSERVGQRIRQDMRAAGQFLPEHRPALQGSVCLWASLTPVSLWAGLPTMHNLIRFPLLGGGFKTMQNTENLTQKEERLRWGWLGHRTARLDEGPTDNPGTAISKEPPLGLMEGQKLSLSNH